MPLALQDLARRGKLTVQTRQQQLQKMAVLDLAQDSGACLGNLSVRKPRFPWSRSSQHFRG